VSRRSALRSDFKDIVVLIPGISGSALSKGKDPIWGPSASAIWRTLRTGGESINHLRVEAEDTSKDEIDDVIATGLIPDVHLIPGLWKIDGYTKIRDALVRELNLEFGHNYFEFPYDWRRDNRVSARKLQRTTEAWLNKWRERPGNQEARLVLVCHSMGGLVARYFLEVFGGWKDSRLLITFGTPFRGSLNAAGFLANGFSKSIGPFTLDLSCVLRSFNSVYQLLPTYKCIEKHGCLYHVSDDEVEIDNLSKEQLVDARDFHDEIRKAAKENSSNESYHKNGYETYAVIGTKQPTFQSAMLVGNEIGLLESRLGESGARLDQSGDGTVPQVSATFTENDSIGRAMYVYESHGSLQNDKSALNHVISLIKGAYIDFSEFRAPEEISIGANFAHVYSKDSIILQAAASHTLPQILATITGIESDESNIAGKIVARGHVLRSIGGQNFEGSSLNLPSGIYRATLTGENARPVVDIFAVM
jgi:hypothetical protein